MRTLALGVVSVLVLLPAAARAQHVVFEEDFEGGLTGWTNIYQSAILDPWGRGFRRVDGSRDVYHEYYCTNGFVLRNNLLLSPVIDLSGVTQAFFECGQYQRFPTSRLYNAVKITTDGGRSYTEIYRERGTFTGFNTIKVDISAWAGNSNVQVAFHYRGVVANEWSVDNVRITTSSVRHLATALVAGGQASYAVDGAVPGNSIFIVLSAAGSGPVLSPWGNINLFPPLVPLPGMIADPNGRVGVNFTVPNGTAGATIYSQAIEFAPPTTLNLTNSVARTIK